MQGGFSSNWYCFPSNLFARRYHNFNVNIPLEDISSPGYKSIRNLAHGHSTDSSNYRPTQTTIHDPIANVQPQEINQNGNHYQVLLI
jgi:hypothetical protein